MFKIYSKNLKNGTKFIKKKVYSTIESIVYKYVLNISYNRICDIEHKHLRVCYEFSHMNIALLVNIPDPIILCNRFLDCDEKKPVKFVKPRLYFVLYPWQ